MGIFGTGKVNDPFGETMEQVQERRRIERAAKLEQKCDMLERENERLRRENKGLRRSVDALGHELTEARRRLRAEKRALLPADAAQALRASIEGAYGTSRERALALTRLDECEMWLERCEPKETAAPTLKGAASPADAPCLEDSQAADFRLPDVNVEVTDEKAAESVLKAMQEAKPALRMAVE